MPRAANPPPEMAAFDGFAPDALDFFTELDTQQTRDWFVAHKDRYERTIRDPLARLVGSLSLAFEVHDIPLTGDAKSSLFRIHRDMRFAKDKRPSRLLPAGVLTRDGSKRSPGLVYIQLGPESCFVAAGFYALEPDALEAFRRHILAHPPGWAAVTAALARAKLPLARDDATARLPRGYNAAKLGDVADDIRLKSFTIQHALAPSDITSAALIDRVVALARAAEPLLRFGWAALAGLGSG